MPISDDTVRAVNIAIDQEVEAAAVRLAHGFNMSPVDVLTFMATRLADGLFDIAPDKTADIFSSRIELNMAALRVDKDCVLERQTHQRAVDAFRAEAQARMESVGRPV